MDTKKYDLVDINSILIDIPLPEINKIKTSSSEYVDDGILAGNRLNMLLRIISTLIPNANIAKQPQGIMLGKMVRLAKLYNSFLLLSSKNESEAAMLISRALVETSIHLKYLRNKISDELCEKIIRSSLCYDKKLWEFVSSKIKNREPIEFENRILQTIQNNFLKFGINIEDINYKKENKWCISLLSLSEKVDLFDVYEVIYRLLSRVEHGAWQHLESYNLKDEGDFYSPELVRVEIDPQIIFSTSYLCIEGSLNYLGYIDISDECLIKYLKELLIWFQTNHKDYASFKAKENN